MALRYLLSYYFILLLLFIGGHLYPKLISNIPENFPKALLVNGKPIHPECVLSTVFGELSQLVYTDLTQADIKNSKDAVLDYSNLDKNTVFSSYTFTYDYEGARDYYSDVYYCAWPVSDEIALVLVKHHSTDGTGRFSNLALVKREGDFLLNTHSIAQGDRSHGTVWVESFKDDLLQFKTLATTQMMMNALQNQLNLEKPFEEVFDDSVLNPAGELVWKCQIQKDVITTPILTSVEFY